MKIHCHLIQRRKEQYFTFLNDSNDYEICFYYSESCSEIYLVSLNRSQKSLWGYYHKSAGLSEVLQVHPELGRLLVKNIDILRKSSQDDLLYIKVGDFFLNIYPHLDILSKEETD